LIVCTAYTNIKGSIATVM